MSMRLLHFNEQGELGWTVFSKDTIPSYAILSHTWGSEEVSFEDLVHNSGKEKAGYRKILFCGEQAGRDQLQYFWVDTCCIDKRNLHELSKAINSMFLWYRNAVKCYAFLSDVPTLRTTNAESCQSTWEAAFRKSRWFTRGWTLQELIAPASVEFFSPQHQRLGDKQSLERQIHEITGVSVKALQGYPMDSFSVAERMSWAENRQTTEEEDSAYCLLGIFGVFMPLIYAEGKANALKRLRKTINEATNPEDYRWQEEQSKSILVPYKNPDFVGRADILGEVKSRLGPSLRGSGTTFQTRLALFGLGGIGKTQIALAFAHWVLAEFAEILVFWIHASTTERFQHAYIEIAKGCRIPGYDDPKADTMALIKAWLEQKTQRRWLMILDNVDDPEVLFGGSNADSRDVNHSSPASSNRKLVDSIPRCPHGVVLVTTRNKQAALQLTSGRSVLHIGPLDHAESCELISKRLDDDCVDPEQTYILADHLGHLPLALAQAAAFISQNSLTVEKYIQLLERSDNDLVSLLSQPFEDESRDSSVPNAVAATWIVSFKQIQEHHSFSGQLLSLMSFFDWQDIPKLFLAFYQEHGAGLDASQVQEELCIPKGAVELEKALGVIKAFSFISESEAEDSFDMHRLTQLVMRKWLIVEAKAGWWQSLALGILSTLFPYGDYENWTVCTRYIPHVFSVLTHAECDSDKDATARATLQNRVAVFMLFQGKWYDAEPFQSAATEIRKKVLGEEHPDTLNSINNLASTYWNQGRLEEAEELEVQVIETRKRVLGAEHLYTLNSINNLASTYRNQGRLKEAEELYIQVMETRKRVLGAEHPDTLISMNNLAYTWKGQGRDKEAIALMRECVQLRERVSGLEHPHTLLSRAALSEWEMQDPELESLSA